LFEIIYPENRICVDYGTKKDLIFLSAFEIESGKEVHPSVPFSCAETHLGCSGDFEYLQKLNWDNKEGFVVKFEDGFRFKIKFEEYKRLHHVIFSLSTKSIWESLRSGKDIDLDRIPDELYSWIKKESIELKNQYQIIEKIAQDKFQQIKKLPRKDFAREAIQYNYSSILFKMLDKKPYNDIIWKTIEPEFRTPTNASVREET
jgi:RNA ligase